MGRVKSGATALLALAATAASGQSVEIPPAMLPGDAPPPPMAQMLRPPRKPSERPPEVPYAAPGSPTNEDALLAAQAALAICTSEAHHVAVTVTDAEGRLRAGITDPEARPQTVFTAMRKALAAATFAMPTSVLQQKLRDDETLRTRIMPSMAVFPGAVPIFSKGALIGAIGVSGATGEEDEACARSGADRLAASTR